MPAHDLLHDDLITVRLGSEIRAMSLPAVLSALARGESLEFRALRPHQQHAWYAFLVQLGAVVCQQHETTPRDLDTDAWRDFLLRSAGATTSFCLVVEDLSAPALLQPPVPEGRLDALKNEAATPDLLDLLATSRNHDVKRRRMRRPAPEHWLYAVVSLQTMEGFGGAKNYGISRMNGGLSNRPCVAIGPSDDWSARFVRDVRVWLEQRELLVERYRYDPTGTAFVWELPWDGTEKLATDRLHPFYIECCRRIRLCPASSGGILARVGSSDSARIDTANQNGDTGDAWTPVALDSGKSLTVPADGFSYKRLQDLFFSGNWRRAASQSLRPEDGERPLILARTLVRGQGKTDGYHERVVPIPPKARGFFATPEGHELMGKRSVQMVDLAGTARRKVLRPALQALLQGGPERVDGQDDRVDALCNELDRRVDDLFFGALFDGLDHSEDDAMARWQRSLFALCKDIFETSRRALPVPLARSYRSLAIAETRLWRAARFNLKGAFMKEDDERTPAAG